MEGIQIKNLELKNILITFVNDNENIIKELERELDSIMPEYEDYEKEIEKESIYYEIDNRNDMVRDAKLMLKELDK